MESIICFWLREVVWSPLLRIAEIGNFPERRKQEEVWLKHGIGMSFRDLEREF